jgi:hypothetical protein
LKRSGCSKWAVWPTPSYQESVATGQVVGGGVGDVVEEVATLVISVRTAGVHVSHILRKLGAPNRLEAAGIAHRLSPPPTAQVIT